MDEKKPRVQIKFGNNTGRKTGAVSTYIVFFHLHIVAYMIHKNIGKRLKTYVI